PWRSRYAGRFGATSAPLEVRCETAEVTGRDFGQDNPARHTNRFEAKGSQDVSSSRGAKAGSDPGSEVQRSRRHQVHERGDGRRKEVGCRTYGLWRLRQDGAEGQGKPARSFQAGA